MKLPILWFQSRPVCIVWILAAFLSLSGCSMRRLAINNAELVAEHTLGRYVDLTDTQEEVALPRLREHVRWAKETQFPILRRALLEAENRLSGSVTETDVGHLLGITYKMREDMGTRLAADAAELAVSLSAEQIDELEQYLTKSNDSILKKLKLSDEELVAEQQMETVSFAEKIAGDFSADQQRRLLEIFPAGRESIETWLGNRKQLHAAIATLLRQGKPKAELTAIFLGWAKEPYLLRSETREAWEAREARRGQKIAAFVALLTPKQIGRLKAELSALANDLGP